MASEREISALIERAEKLTGADREFDARLCVAANDRPEWLRPDPRRLYGDKFGHVSAGKNGPGFTAPMYSASLDAIVALVEMKLPGWSWECRASGTGDKGQATVWNPSRAPGRNQEQRAYNCATPAIALCIVLLRSLQSKGQSNGL